MPTRFRLWGACAIGKIREQQEDAIALPQVGDHRPEQALREVDGRGWAVVADGIGGNPAGEVASELACAMMASMLPQIAPEQLRGCLQLVDDELRAAMNSHPEFGGMGTTIVGALADEDCCLVFNLGDSRAYLSSADGLRQLSCDHSAEGYLTGFLGGSGPSFEPPHITRVRLQSGAKILLCTDGLTNMLPDREIESVLKSEPKHPAKALVDASVAAGGHDNVSVVVMQR